ncbi:MAG: PQQ-dependent catabolism-associated CXXCW motif protein [Hyphomicrobium sp.]
MNARAAVFVAALAAVAAAGFAAADENLHTPPPVNSPPSAEPEGYRMEDYRKPVPATLRGAIVLSAKAALELWRGGSAVFIDVYPHAPKPANLPAGTLWREPVHYSIENAKWLPNVGYGVLSRDTEAYFRSSLERLTGGVRSIPIVFFCLRNCWMSWNAAKRAMSDGYTAVNWFPDGSDAWQEIGQLVTEVKPEK